MTFNEPNPLGPDLEQLRNERLRLKAEIMRLRGLLQELSDTTFDQNVRTKINGVLSERAKWQTADWGHTA